MRDFFTVVAVTLVICGLALVGGVAAAMVFGPSIIVTNAGAFAGGMLGLSWAGSVMG